MIREALVIGGGAREHALVATLVASGSSVWACPGNGGIAQDATIISADRPEDILAYFGTRRPLVIIGPEVPLAEGWSDRLRQEGFPVVGPSQAAARLESSKRLAKEVMVQYDIPAAQSKVAYRHQDLTVWIDEETVWPKVLKQSGLAQGKGVRIVQTAGEAQETLIEWQLTMEQWAEGILWEDYLTGFELSIQVITNGIAYRWLPVAQDYKRLGPEPDSPNTGGMGAIAPVLISSESITAINRQIFDPIMQYLKDNQLFYHGVLYAGLMMTTEGPRVLEFNVRLGDPEAEAILPILEVDWWDFWLKVSQGDLPDVPSPQCSAVAVVMAATGYPVAPKRGMAIRLGPRHPNTTIYHGGTEVVGGQVESQGGRVLTVVGIGKTSTEARGSAYGCIAGLDFPESYYRKDIGLGGRQNKNSASSKVLGW